MFVNHRNITNQILFSRSIATIKKIVFLMIYEWVNSGKCENHFTGFMYPKIDKKKEIRTAVNKYAV